RIQRAGFGYRERKTRPSDGWAYTDCPAGIILTRLARRVVQISLARERANAGPGSASSSSAKIDRRDSHAIHRYTPQASTSLLHQEKEDVDARKAGHDESTIETIGGRHTDLRPSLGGERRDGGGADLRLRHAATRHTQSHHGVGHREGAQR